MCLHKSRILPLFFHRAKPDSEMERSGIELSHCGVAKSARKPCSKRYALEQGEGRSGKWSADVSGFEIKNS